MLKVVVISFGPVQNKTKNKKQKTMVLIVFLINSAYLAIQYFLNIMN